ncbi:TetR/AcrR family transcriptional regulator [Brevibacillus choshinensis]|uniref:TetR/AcrR family transcriptional regulator n=1 Tax=Brevibacillus choshinensis TaxID=54911 RepID=A0ABX7FLL0_BRECH|nr:TetR/AcrR family transcriptional regulator [Brevibacillus choshinensis]QRG66530.1 TetR/AcrR family transcriptional regulator [Brevibacillus choshinensis]
MKQSKEEQKKATIRKLTEVARVYFSERGYADASMEEMVKEAGLTRGALYHHFSNKEGLFHAVLEMVQGEIAERVETEAAKSEDVWGQLILGCRAFISAAVESPNRRIMLIDGPSVLGWETWRRMDEQHSMRLLHDQLQEMQEQGYLKPVSITCLTHLLSGAMNEAVLWISQLPESQQALDEVTESLALMLEGFRAK